MQIQRVKHIYKLQHYNQPRKIRGLEKHFQTCYKDYAKNIDMKGIESDGIMRKSDMNISVLDEVNGNPRCGGFGGRGLAYLNGTTSEAIQETQNKGRNALRKMKSSSENRETYSDNSVTSDGR